VNVAFAAVALEKLPVPPWNADAVTVPEYVELAAVMPLVTFRDVAVAFTTVVLPPEIVPDVKRLVVVALPSHEFDAARLVAVAFTKTALVAVAFVDDVLPVSVPATLNDPVTVRLPMFAVAIVEEACVVVDSVEVPLTESVPPSAIDDVAVNDPAIALPWSVEEAREADDVAVSVPNVPV